MIQSTFPRLPRYWEDSRFEVDWKNMGASGWSYFVPYEVDISAALQRLRRDVFARGDYLFGDGLTEDQRDAIFEKVRPEIDPWMRKVREAAAQLQEPLKTKYLEMADSIKNEVMGRSPSPREPKRKPETIEQLLELQGENGTHSILDVVDISTEPKFGSISPLPRTRLVKLFGSETPSRAKVEESHDNGSLEEFISRPWQGIYVIAHCNGLPSEIFFAGCSGD